MDNKNLYNGLIFILERYDELTGESSFATAPFFLIDETCDSITIKQIRDANFSQLLPPNYNGFLGMKLYVIKKNTLKFPLRKSFQTLIKHLIKLSLENRELEINGVPLEIVAYIDYPARADSYQKPKEGILEMRLEKFHMADNKVYLYNPSITLSKDYLNKM